MPVLVPVRSVRSAAGVATLLAAIAIACSADPATSPPSDPPEPTFAATGGTLVWTDAFDAYTSDSALHRAYVTLAAEAIHRDAAGGRNGTGATRIDWPAATSCTDYSPLLEHAFDPTPEVYLTFSVRYTPGFRFDWGHSGGPCTGNAKKLFFLWAKSGSRWDFISENHSLGVGSDFDHPLFAQNVGVALTDEALADGGWHRFTFHVRQSSTPTAKDGFIYGWIDGQLRWAYPDIASNNSGGYYDFKVPTTFNQGSPVAQSEWLDDLALWRP